MKRVVIGMRNGKPYVIHAQGKVEVIFKQEPSRNFKKTIRTALYHTKKALGF